MRALDSPLPKIPNEAVLKAYGTRMACVWHVYGTASGTKVNGFELV